MKAAALLVGLAACGMAVGKMDVRIGDRHIDTFGYDRQFDPFGKTYLYWGIDCDGAHRRIILTTSFESIITNEGWQAGIGRRREEFIAQQKKEFETVKLSNQTGFGIRLGMTRQQVINRLGIPSQSLYSKRFQADELIYQRYTPKNKNGWYDRYANFYLFRNNRLFYIELRRDQIDGPCGSLRGQY